MSDESDRRRAARDRDAADLRSHPRVHWHPGRVDGARVRRIVSLVPSLSEALVALGLGDRLVGVTEYCVEPPGAFDGLPRLGGTKDADVEAIASCEPDLVLANQEENTARVVRRLAQRGIDVRVTYPRTVREGVRLLSELADLGADATTRSRILAPVEQAWSAAEARRRPGEGPRVFCPIWRDPWMTIGPETYIHDLLELSGGCNVFGRGAPKTVDGAPDPGAGAPRERRYPVVSLEAVEATQPEVILLPDEPYAFGSEDAEQLGLLDVPAAKTGRIVPIDGSLVSWYGPRIAQAIQVLAAIFAKP
ncbi:MAG TPA: helical backbone metal receptor [Myxococcota bacterium]|nr:helical backbone metal receptor [Myxococcota bacterium]